MAKTLVFDAIETYQNGEVFLRLKKLTSDGDACGTQQVQFLPGSDVDAVIANANAGMQRDALELKTDVLSIPVDSHDAIKAVTQAIWTPANIAPVTAEVVAATQAQRDAEAQHAQAITDATAREAAANIAKTKAEAAEALAKEATDKANAATQAMNDALAAQVVAEEAQRKKIEFDAAVAAKVQELQPQGA